MHNRQIYEELKSEFDRKKNKKNLKKYKIFLFILALVFVVPFLILNFMKSYEYVDSFDEIWEPIQTPTSWWVVIDVNWDTVNIDFLAEYDIKWRVLAVAQYWDNIFQKIFHWVLREDNIIRYKDVGIWRGFMTQDDYVKRFNRKSFYRFLIPEYKSYEDYLYVNSRYSREDINSHLSHNHLIPADDRIKKLLRGISKGQYVHIKWYLVRMHSKNWYNLTSSLTRDDMWDWACETIYVTDITRLKEK